MLVAELVAARCGKTLAFGGWEGESEGLVWARAMRGWEVDWKAEGFGVCVDVDVDVNVDVDAPAVPVTSSSPKTRTTPAPAPAHPPDSDDDDSLQGYDSPTSSRSPSPTPSELDEIEKDPTLRVGRPKPVSRPVYLVQVIALLRAGGYTNDEGVVEKIEMGLTHVEELVRRKAGFGTELGE